MDPANEHLEDLSAESESFVIVIAGHEAKFVSFVVASCGKPDPERVPAK